MTPCNAATAAAAHPTSGIFAALAATLYFRSKGVQPRFVPHEVYRSVALPDLQLQVRAHAVVCCGGGATYMCSSSSSNSSTISSIGSHLNLVANVLQRSTSRTRCLCAVQVLQLFTRSTTL
jgi:hypothetical protein